MTTPSGYVRWTMLRDVAEALPLISCAAAQQGFASEFPVPAALRIHVPHSLRTRRKATEITGFASKSLLGTDIVWTTGDPASRHYEHLLEIEETLPPGTMYYQGLVEAAANAGFSFTGTAHLRDLVSALNREETVRAAGQGHLGDRPADVLLTDNRLVVLDKDDPGTRPLLDAAYGSIASLTLGKKVSGETLLVALPAMSIEISRLGHGEGHGITTSFRESLRERERIVTVTTNSPGSHGHEQS